MCSALHQNISAHALVLNLAEAPIGRTEVGSDSEERAEDSEQHPRSQCHSPSTKGTLCKDLGTPNLQQLSKVTDGVEAKEKAPFEGDQQQGEEQFPPPRFLPRNQRSFHPRKLHQSAAEEKDGDPSPAVPQLRSRFKNLL